MCGGIQANQQNRKMTASLDVLCVDTTGSDLWTWHRAPPWDNSDHSKPSCKSVLDKKELWQLVSCRGNMPSIGPGGQVTPTCPPPSGLESWPLDDVSQVVDAIAGKCASIRLDDFASSCLIEGTGETWRTNLVKRPDIVDLSSADQVLEARFFTETRRCRLQELLRPKVR